MQAPKTDDATTCSDSFGQKFYLLCKGFRLLNSWGCYQSIRNIPAYFWKKGIDWMYFLTFLLFGFTYYNVESIPHENHAMAVVRAFIAVALTFLVALLHVGSFKIYRCLIHNIHRRSWTFGFAVAIFFLPAAFTIVVNRNGFYSCFLVSYGIGNICQLKYATLDQPDNQERSRGLLDIIGAITLQFLTFFVSSTGSAIASSTGIVIVSSMGSQNSFDVWMPVISNFIGLFFGVVAILPVLEDLGREIYQDCQEYVPIPQGDDMLPPDTEAPQLRNARRPPLDLEAQQHVDVKSDIVSGSDNRQVSGGSSSSFGHLNPGGSNSENCEGLQDLSQPNYEGSPPDGVLA